MDDQVERDSVGDYLRDAAEARRRGLRKAAGGLALGAVLCGALASRMTDIGHFVGFVGLALALLVAAFVVWRSERG